jgi:hypothetical protein
MDPQQLDLHFVLGQVRQFDQVRRVRRDLQVCVHLWAPDLHPNQVTVPPLLHVQPVVPADIPQQQGHLIEVGLLLLLVDPVVPVVVPAVDQELVVPVPVVPVERRVDHDKDRSPRKLVAKRLIIYVHHLSVERLFRTAMEALPSNFVAVHLLQI